jgi:hypothetical protein
MSISTFHPFLVWEKKGWGVCGVTVTDPESYPFRSVVLFMSISTFNPFFIGEKGVGGKGGVKGTVSRD